MKDTMKKLTLIITIGIILFMAQNNYNKAIEATKVCEGTDSSIEQTLSKYGFNCAWYEDIYLSDKVIALFN